MATAMRVAGDKEGEGNKAMVMATRIAGEWTATATKRAMVTATRVWASDGKGDGKGDEEDDGDGNDGGR